MRLHNFSVAATCPAPNRGDVRLMALDNLTLRVLVCFGQKLKNLIRISNFLPTYP
jgi:hypothetical protein